MEVHLAPLALVQAVHLTKIVTLYAMINLISEKNRLALKNSKFNSVNPVFFLSIFKLIIFR